MDIELCSQRITWYDVGMEKLERKMDQMMEVILERFNDIDKRFDDVEQRFTEASKEAQRTKLEMLDKLATKDSVAEHELRLQELESKIR